MQTIGFDLWRERRADLLCEAENERLARQLRKSGRRGRAYGFWGRLRRWVRPAPRRSGDEAPDVRVRWGLPEDEERISDLLQLNGLPGRLAGEGFIVAEKGGEVMAAVSYRTEAKRLVLGLLVADPWAEERPLAEALYVNARELAHEIGVAKIR